MKTNSETLDEIREYLTKVSVEIEKMILSADDYSNEEYALFSFRELLNAMDDLIFIIKGRRLE